MRSSRIGVCSWSLRPQGPGDLIGALRRLGLECVQLALNPALDRPSAWEDAAAELAGAGVGVASGMMAMAGEDYSTLETIRRTGGVTRDAAWDENRRRASACAALAAGWGIGLVSFHAGFLEEAANRRKMIVRLAELADVFAERGVNVALETGQETAATLVSVLEELDRGNVGVNFDPANMILYGMGDPVDALRRAAPFVRQVHVKDALPSTVPGQWGTEVPAGRGVVDWEGFFEIACALEPPVDFIIEREAGAARLGDVAEALALVERYLDR